MRAVRELRLLRTLPSFGCSLAERKQGAGKSRAMTIVDAPSRSNSAARVASISNKGGAPPALARLRLPAANSRGGRGSVFDFEWSDCGRFQDERIEGLLQAGRRRAGSQSRKDVVQNRSIVRPRNIAWPLLRRRPLRPHASAPPPSRCDAGPIGASPVRTPISQ